MAKVVWTKTALNNLEDISDYIALDKSTAAIKLIENITKQTDLLEQFPEIGRKPPEFKKTMYKELVIPPCRIFYSFDDKEVHIIHIIRSEQQLRKYMLEENSIHEDAGSYNHEQNK